jgi:hypothetical protein
MRGEGEIRQDAQMWALVAELEALKTERSAMEAENVCRADRGAAPAFGEEEFMALSKRMQEVAFLLRRDI